jgi:hypothetical protein
MRRVRHVARGLLAAVMVALGSSAAGAQSFGYWYQDGYRWTPGPNGRDVGSCFGNCGAGCSDRNDGNCIPDQYNPQMRWELDYLDGPYETASGEYEECVPEGDSLPRIHRVRWSEHQALGRYTYYGYVTPGCITHDRYCGPSSLYIGCAAFLGCGSPGWFDSWSYEKWLHAYTEDRDSVGWGYYGQC